MTEVQGLLGSTWIFGYAIFMWAFGLCSIITYLMTFFKALVLGDWAATYLEWTDTCWDMVYEYY